MLSSRALVDAVLDDSRTAPLDAAHRALFVFVEKVCKDSTSVRREDVQAVVAAGMTEDAVYDAITVCALFQFYNTWIDATGVHDMPAAAYVTSGQRIASHGYADEPPT